MNQKMHNSLVLVRHDGEGYAEVRLVALTGRSELRVYSQESVADPCKEVHLEVCHVYQVQGGSAHELAQSMVTDWQQEGFSRMDSTGRAFDLDTQTLGEGLSAVLSSIAPAIPAIRSPLWFT